MNYATKENFNELIGKGLVLVDFYADWCGPCKMIAPVLEQISAEDKTVSIVKVNVDQEQALAMQFQVQSIPTLILFKDGKIVNKALGYQPKPQLEKFIASGK